MLDDERWGMGGLMVSGEREIRESGYQVIWQQVIRVAGYQEIKECRILPFGILRVNSQAQDRYRIRNFECRRGGFWAKNEHISLFFGIWEKSGKSLKIVELKGNLGYNVSAFEALLLEQRSVK